MNQKENAKAFMEKVAEYGSVLGLSAITALMDELGHPEDKLQIIHVAGTNGKGSTSKFIQSVLSAEGYRVGVYSSPAVFCYEERYAINGANIEENLVYAYMNRLEKACQLVVDKGYSHPTLFEVETALAFLYFAEENCDYVIFEVGMGGETDATNVISKSLCSVFVSIGMDHMQFLGSDIKDIAKVKAGIMKEQTTAVSIWQPQDVIDVLYECAKGKKVDLHVCDRKQVIVHTEQPLCFSYKEFKNIKIQMLGLYQLDNAVLALEVIRTLRSLGGVISNKSVEDGMKHAFWPGRMECLSRDCNFYIDGAHNLPAALRLKETLQQCFTNKKIIYIIGVLADKEHQKMLIELLPFCEKVFTITPNNPRAYDGNDLAKDIGALGYEATYCATIEKAIDAALQEKAEVRLALGSLSYLGEFKKTFLQVQGEGHD